MSGKQQTVRNLEGIAKDLCDKSYQIEGAFSTFATRVPKEEGDFIKKSLNELRGIGKRLNMEVERVKKIYAEVDDDERKARKSLAEYRSSNCKLKRKLYEYESDFNESITVSSQELSTSGATSTSTSSEVSDHDNTLVDGQEDQENID